MKIKGVLFLFIFSTTLFAYEIKTLRELGQYLELRTGSDVHVGKGLGRDFAIIENLESEYLDILTSRKELKRVVQEVLYKEFTILKEINGSFFMWSLRDTRHFVPAIFSVKMFRKKYSAIGDEYNTFIVHHQFENIELCRQKIKELYKDRVISRYGRAQCLGNGVLTIGDTGKAIKDSLKVLNL